MPLGELLQALERDADAEARAVTAAAEADVARIDAESARRCGEELARAVRAATEEQRLAADARLADAERQRRREILEARAAMLGRIRAGVHEELPRVIDDGLRAKLAAAAGEFGEGTSRDTPTGVVVELADGTRVDATLDAMLERAWPRLAAEALALVDAEGS